MEKACERRPLSRKRASFHTTGPQDPAADIKNPTTIK
jgi:hypothetical protein